MNTETATEMCSRWQHECEARDEWIDNRAEQIACVGGMGWDAAVACATNEYWNGDMPESVEKEIGR